MAITPRTILTHPVYLVMFLVSALVLGGLAGLVTSVDEPADDDRKANLTDDEASGEVDAERRSGDAGSSEDVGLEDSERWKPAGVDLDRRDHRCTLAKPASDWREAHWLRHLDCMEARDEPKDDRLAKVDEAIDEVGLTEMLAVEKSDLLEERAEFDENRAFLEEAVDELGTADAELNHRLARALTWRGDRDDFERIRHLQLLSRSTTAEECQALQTDVWVRYLLAHRFAERPSPAAFDAVREAIDVYRARDCTEQRHTGQFDELAEIVGVGVAAEQVDGHGAHGALIREVATSFDILDPERLCERAVPNRDGLRGHCEDRLTDELQLSER